MFLSTRGCQTPHGENTSSCWGVLFRGSDGAVGREFNGDQSKNMLDKTSFSRNTHKTRSHLDWSRRNGTRGSQVPKPIFSVGNMVQYLLIQESWKFYKI